MDNDIIQIKILEAKLGYISTLLASYSSLNLSKIINDIHLKLYLLEKTIIEKKDYIDIRDAMYLKNEVTNLKNILPNKEIYLSGHKIACLLFEISFLLKKLKNEINVNDDIKEYLENVCEYLFLSGRYVNIQLLCNENYIIENNN